MSDERFWGSIGGRLERFWGRWRRYGAAEGQGGVEPEKYKYKDKYKDKDKDGGMGQWGTQLSRGGRTCLRSGSLSNGGKVFRSGSECIQ